MRHRGITEAIRLDGARQIRALSLLSGGLDSRLAVILLREQSVDVHGVVFDSPFFDAEKGKAAAEELGVPVHVIDFSGDIVALLKNPPHGFGACMNPCVDCHMRMLARTGELMEELGFDFVSTGEVLNQRPMSQNRQSLEIVAGQSGYGDLVLRPLSARLMPETRPEREGWVDRSRLLAIEGRSRRRQMELAERYGLSNYPTPAGGCLLTEPGFCKRLRDLKDHEGLNGVRSLNLLRFGRHFRLSDSVKMIVGRNEKDNAYLEGNAELYDLLIKVEGFPGPTGLLPLVAGQDSITLGAAICARYSDAPKDRQVEVEVRIRSARGIQKIRVVPAEPASVDQLRI